MKYYVFVQSPPTDHLDRYELEEEFETEEEVNAYIDKCLHEHQDTAEFWKFIIIHGERMEVKVSTLEEVNAIPKRTKLIKELN